MLIRRFSPYGYQRPALQYSVLPRSSDAIELASNRLDPRVRMVLAGFGDAATESGYTPPAGWSIDRGPTLVTAANQSEYVASNCTVADSVGVDVATPDGSTAKAPPVGWFAVNLLKDGVPDVAWINPTSGQQYLILSTCAEVGFVDANMLGKMQQWSYVYGTGGNSGSMLPWLMGAAAIGILLWQRFRGKKTSKLPRNRAARLGRPRRRRA